MVCKETQLLRGRELRVGAGWILEFEPAKHGFHLRFEGGDWPGLVCGVPGQGKDVVPDEDLAILEFGKDVSVRIERPTNRSKVLEHQFLGSSDIDLRFFVSFASQSGRFAKLDLMRLRPRPPIDVTVQCPAAPGCLAGAGQSRTQRLTGALRL